MLRKRPILQVDFMNCGKTADSVEMPFGVMGRMGPMNHVLYGSKFHPRNWQFLWGVEMGWCNVTYL